MAKKKDDDSNFYIKYFTVLGIILSPFLVYSIYYLFKSDHKIISASLLVIATGIAIESLKYCEKKITILKLSIGSLIFSSLFLIPINGFDKIESSIKISAYLFIIIFTFISAIYYHKQMLPRVTEGIALVQSIAIIYWMSDFNLDYIANPFVFVAVVIGFFMIIFTFIHAFTKIKIIKKDRFTLSIWSSILVIILGIDTIWKFRNTIFIEEANNVWETALLTVQYLLYGMSLIHMAQNILLMFLLIPTGKYDQVADDFKSDHIGRTSDLQTSRALTFLTLIVSGTFFYLNFKYNFLPKNFAIWLVLIVFGNILFFHDYLKRLRIKT